MSIFNKTKKEANGNTKVWVNKKSRVRVDNDLRWNKMWDLWCEGKVPSPYADLMSYQSDVHTIGHAKFFEKIAAGDMTKTLAYISKMLPASIKLPLHEAYHAYKVNGPDAEENGAFFDHCDEALFANEKAIDDFLMEFAKNIKI